MEETIYEKMLSCIQYRTHIDCENKRTRKQLSEK